MSLNTRLNRAALLALSAAFAGVASVPGAMPMSDLAAPSAPGWPIGLAVPPNTPFTDSRGRRYVRDERGVVRRVVEL